MNGFHKHKCHYCGFVWQHADACDVSHNAVPGSHECPSCNRCNWELGIYDGDEEPSQPAVTAMTALRILRKSAKVVEKCFIKGIDLTADQASDFVNAIITANGVPGVDDAE